MVAITAPSMKSTSPNSQATSTPGGEIGAVAERFEIGGEGAVGEATIEAGDAADLRIAERRGDGAEESGFDADVAIADEHNFVARFAHHAAELVDLVARAERLGADEQANRARRENRE